MIELFLVFVFIGATGIAFVMVLRKVPLLLQVPANLIDESFVTRPNRLKKASDAVVDFFRSGRWREWIYESVIWILGKFRVILLRWERSAFRTAERLEASQRSLEQTNGRYISELKEWRNGRRTNDAGTSLPNPAEEDRPATGDDHTNDSAEVAQR